MVLGEGAGVAKFIKNEQPHRTLGLHKHFAQAESRDNTALGTRRTRVHSDLTPAGDGEGQDQG